MAANTAAAGDASSAAVSSFATLTPNGAMGPWGRPDGAAKVSATEVGLWPAIPDATTWSSPA